MTDSASEIAARRNSAAATDSRVEPLMNHDGEIVDAPQSAHAVPATGSRSPGRVPPSPSPDGTGTGTGDGVGMFTSLRVPAFRALWWSGAFSFISVHMQFLLRGLLAWDLTESEGALGLVYLPFGLTLLLATPLGGVMADRLPKRRLMLAGQMILTLTALGMGVAVATGAVRFWMLLIAAALQGLMFGLIGPARISMTTEIVGRERIGNAITLSSLSMSGSRLFAPSLAGTLAGWALFGLGGAYFVSAACATVSCVLLLPLPETRPAARTGSAGAGRSSHADASEGSDTQAVPEHSEVRNPAGAVHAPQGAAAGATTTLASAIGGAVADITEGVRYAMSRPKLRRAILVATTVIMFGFSYVAFLPALVEGLFGRSEADVGYLTSATAVGAIIAAGLLATRADSPNAPQFMVIAGFGFGVSVVALGVSPSYWVAMAVALGVGAAATGFMTLAQVLAMRYSDDAHQGRVQSLVQLAFAAFALTAAPAGAFAELIGLRIVIAAMGVAVIAATAIYMLASRADAGIPPSTRRSLGDAPTRS